MGRNTSERDITARLTAELVGRCEELAYECDCLARRADVIAPQIGEALYEAMEILYRAAGEQQGREAGGRWQERTPTSR